MRLGRLALFLAAALISIPSGSAGAAVVVGSNLGQPPNGTICVQPSVAVMSCTVGLTGLPLGSRAPGGVIAGSKGVVTSWSVRSGAAVLDHSIRLRLIRNHTGAGTGPVETLPAAAGIYTYQVRLPVQANDMIGVDTLNVLELHGAPIIRTAVSGASIDYWIGTLADGENRSPSSTSSTIEPLVNATIESDADGDGFGDETQDQCPSDASTQGACPSGGGGGGSAGGGGSTSGTGAPAAAAPETILGKRPAGTIHSRRVSFRFNANIAGSTFQCKLDKKPFKACRSPKAYKGLAEGRHVFKVRAVGPTGLVDPTPGKRTVKVEL